MTNLRTRDIIALGFMTFALFIGAGNIIFPPIVAQQAGEHVWLAALGFLITAVGLPVITIMALSRVEGSIQIHLLLYLQHQLLLFRITLVLAQVLIIFL